MRQLATTFLAIAKVLLQVTDILLPLYKDTGQEMKKELYKLSVATTLLPLTFTCFASAANAQTGSNHTIAEEQSKTRSEWDISVGLSYQYNFKQSDKAESKSELTPGLDINYASGPLSLSLDGLSYEFLQAHEEAAIPGLSLSANLGVDMGRSKDDPVKGIEKISPNAKLGLAANYEINEIVSVGLDVSKSFTDAKSLQVTGNIETAIPMNERTLLTLGANATWSNKDHMQTYYGVTSAQSSRTGLAAHTANSGLESIGVDAGIYYNITENWVTGVQATYSRLQSDAANSPLKVGDTDASVSIGLGYIF